MAMMVPVKYEIVDGADREVNHNRHDANYIEERLQREGPPKWVVTTIFKDVLNRDGEWEWEPQPSSRTDEFKARTRFDSAEEALEFYVRFKS